MSDQKIIRNFLMIFFASLGLAVVLLAVWDSALRVTVVGNGEPELQEATSTSASQNQPSEAATWYERAIEKLTGFVLTTIVSSRLILLAGIMLFYGYIFAYVAPSLWRRIRGHMGRAVHKKSSG